MYRKPWWLALGLAAFVGCESQSEPNNNLIPSPPGIQHATSPTKGEPGQAPAGYPGAEKGPSGATEPGQAEPGKAEPGKAEPGKAEEPKGESPKAEPAKTEEKKAASKSDEAAAQPVTLSEEEVAEIKKLPADQQEAALKQKLCPISGEHLGEMGVPLRVSAGGETFFLCCKGCQKDLKDEKKLQAALAKLKTTK